MSDFHYSNLYLFSLLKKYKQKCNGYKSYLFKEITVKDTTNISFDYNLEIYSKEQKLLTKGSVNSSSNFFAMPNQIIKMTLPLKTVIFCFGQRFGDSVEIFWGNKSKKNYINPTITYGDASTNYLSTIEFIMPDTKNCPLNIEISRMVGEPIVKRQAHLQFEMEDDSPNKHGSCKIEIKEPTKVDYDLLQNFEQDYNFTFTGRKTKSYYCIINSNIKFSGEIDNIWYEDENNNLIEILKDEELNAFIFSLDKNTKFHIRLKNI